MCNSLHLRGGSSDQFDRPPQVVETPFHHTTKNVSLTVTEKGYGIDRRTGGADPSHPAIAADLTDPANPQGVVGLLVWAIRQRHQAGVPPFAVLSCDNLPENGALTRGLLVDFARRTAPDLALRIAEEVAFPATMVDRITPARCAGTLDLARELLGRTDAAAVECEAFRQWVMEDHFPIGRPDWQAGGALFVRDVRSYETMKLRMLNGIHSMLAYAGFLVGHRYVRDVMQDAALSRLVQRHLDAAAATLAPLFGVDLAQYARDLVARFSNTHLAHETIQIAMDGSEKIPQRIFAPTVEALRGGQPVEPFAFAAAVWMRYTLGITERGETYDLRDPLSSALRPRFGDSTSPHDLFERICDIDGLVPKALRENDHWSSAVQACLSRILSVGMRKAIASEADR